MNGLDVDLCVLPVRVSQVFDVETSDMLFEIRTNRLSTVQYCHACPTSNLLAIAFSNYAVEVKTHYYIHLFLVMNHVLYNFKLHFLCFRPIKLLLVSERDSFFVCFFFKHAALTSSCGIWMPIRRWRTAADTSAGCSGFSSLQTAHSCSPAPTIRRSG